MAGRIRSIKPELLEDEHVAALSHVAWRLWISSYLLADDLGNFRAVPLWLAGQAFWGNPVDPEEIAKALDELATCKGGGNGLIEMYTVRGQRYAHISGWGSHQKIDHVGKPHCPGPDHAEARKYVSISDSRAVREPFASASRESREPLAPDQDPDQDQDQDLRPGPVPQSDEAETRPEEAPSTVELKLDESPPSGLSIQIQTVWGKYRDHHPNCPGTLKQARKEYRLARDRLADFSVAQLCKAIDGYHRSPFHTGVNGDGAKYLGFELIMRDVDHVTRGIEMADDPALTQGLSEKTRKTVNALATWAGREK